MRIKFLPTVIEYRNLSPQIGVDALELGIAIARHISMTQSPADPPEVYDSQMREAAEGSFYTSDHVAGGGGHFFLTSTPDRKTLIVMFGIPPDSQTLAREERNREGTDAEDASST